MKPLSPDTTPEAQLKQYELMRRLSPEQKLSMAFALTDMMRQLAHFMGSNSITSGFLGLAPQALCLHLLRRFKRQTSCKAA